MKKMTQRLKWGRGEQALGKPSLSGMCQQDNEPEHTEHRAQNTEHTKHDPHNAHHQAHRPYRTQGAERAHQTQRTIVESGHQIGQTGP